MYHVYKVGGTECILTAGVGTHINLFFPIRRCMYQSVFPRWAFFFGYLDCFARAPFSGVPPPHSVKRFFVMPCFITDERVVIDWLAETVNSLLRVGAGLVVELSHTAAVSYR